MHTLAPDCIQTQRYTHTSTKTPVLPICLFQPTTRFCSSRSPHIRPHHLSLGPSAIYEFLPALAVLCRAVAWSRYLFTTQLRIILSFSFICAMLLFSLPPPLLLRVRSLRCSTLYLLWYFYGDNDDNNVVAWSCCYCCNSCCLRIEVMQYCLRAFPLVDFVLTFSFYKDLEIC